MRTAIEQVGALVRFLPPYSPDFNPIVLAFAKLKAFLRAARPRNFEQVCVIVPAALFEVWPSEQAAALLDDAGRPAFSRHVSSADRTKLLQWNVIEAFTKDAVLQYHSAIPPRRNSAGIRESFTGTRQIPRRVSRDVSRTRRCMTPSDLMRDDHARRLAIAACPLMQVKYDQPGSVVPFTLIVILPTNTRLLDPTLDPQGAELSKLLNRWGRLHAVRSALGTVAFLIFLARIVMRLNNRSVGLRPKAVKFCHSVGILFPHAVPTEKSVPVAPVDVARDHG